MKIEKWQVENGIAKPCNLFKQSEMGNFTIVNVDEVGKYAAFEQLAKQHNYPTKLENDIYNADDIEIVWDGLNTKVMRLKHTQPLNPNAIKVVSDRIKELKALNDQYDQYNIFDRIDELQDILKLLQS